MLACGLCVIQHKNVFDTWGVGLSLGEGICKVLFIDLKGIMHWWLSTIMFSKQRLEHAIFLVACLKENICCVHVNM